MCPHEKRESSHTETQTEEATWSWRRKPEWHSDKPRRPRFAGDAHSSERQGRALPWGRQRAPGPAATPWTLRNVKERASAVSGPRPVAPCLGTPSTSEQTRSRRRALWARTASGVLTCYVNPLVPSTEKCHGVQAPIFVKSYFKHHFVIEHNWPLSSN